MSKLIFGSKLACNNKYGRPSSRKLRLREEGWTSWKNGMQLLRDIHREVDHIIYREPIWGYEWTQ